MFERKSMTTLMHIFMYSSFCIVLSRGATTVEQNLTNHLFKDYNKQVRPVYSPNTPIIVTFGLELIQLVNVENRNQLLTTKVWIRQKWQNMLLTWNPVDWGGIDSIQVDGDMVWIPDIVLYNNAHEDFSGGTERYKTRITILADGTNIWLSPALFISTCKIDIRYFPFDEQQCFLKFGSWSFSKSSITLITDPRPLVTSQYVNSTEWEVVGAEGDLNEVLYNCCTDPYMDITFQFRLLRKPLYYVFNVILPCVVLVLTILFGFFLPPESGERISLTITILLAVAVFLQLISDTLPRNSDTVPALGIFYMVVMAESALSLVTTCIVLVYHYRSANEKPLPEWARRIFLRKLGKFLGIHASSSNAHTKGHQNGGYKCDSSKVSPNAEETSGHLSSNLKGQELKLTEILSDGKSNFDEKSENIMKSILSEIKLITSTIKEKHNAEIVEEEWRFLAKVLDRFFFWIFFVTVLLTSVCILVPARQVYH